MATPALVAEVGGKGTEKVVQSITALPSGVLWFTVRNMEASTDPGSDAFGGGEVLRVTM
jgi:hypothetical protein